VDVAAFATQRETLLTALSDAVGRSSASLIGAVTFVTRDARLRAQWQLTIPAVGWLYYRVPGEADWNTVKTPRAATHFAELTNVESRRSVEWYLLWGTDSGAMGCDLRGLQPDGWAHLAE